MVAADASKLSTSNSISPMRMIFCLMAASAVAGWDCGIAAGATGAAGCGFCRSAAARRARGLGLVVFLAVAFSAQRDDWRAVRAADEVVDQCLSVEDSRLSHLPDAIADGKFGLAVLSSGDLLAAHDQCAAIWNHYLVKDAHVGGVDVENLRLFDFRRSPVEIFHLVDMRIGWRLGSGTAGN